MGMRSTADNFITWLLRTVLQSAFWGHVNAYMKQIW